MNDTVDFVVEDFPQWALYYAVYRDSTGITHEEKKMIQDWMKENNVCCVDVLSEESHFSGYPAFGDACECERVRCYN